MVDTPAGKGTSFSLVKQGYHGTVHIDVDGFYVYSPPVTRLINAATLSDYFVYRAVHPGGHIAVNAVFVDIVGVYCGAFWVLAGDSEGWAENNWKGEGGGESE
jgi:VCBS repeat-containing protein